MPKITRKTALYKKLKFTKKLQTTSSSDPGSSSSTTTTNNTDVNAQNTHKNKENNKRFQHPKKADPFQKLYKKAQQEKQLKEQERQERLKALELKQQSKLQYYQEVIAIQIFGFKQIWDV